MNDLMIFNNQEFGDIRVLELNGEPWFVGKDVAEKLGYINTRDALKVHVDQEDISEVAIHDGRQRRIMKSINESGLYSLILSSKLPGAKRFKRWVTSEVLPQIRKTGSYQPQKEVIEGLIDVGEEYSIEAVLTNLVSKLKKQEDAKEDVKRVLTARVEELELKKKQLIFEARLLNDELLSNKNLIKRLDK